MPETAKLWRVQLRGYEAKCQKRPNSGEFGYVCQSCPNLAIILLPVMEDFMRIFQLAAALTFFGLLSPLVANAATLQVRSRFSSSTA